MTNMVQLQIPAVGMELEEIGPTMFTGSPSKCWNFFILVLLSPTTVF